MLNRPTRDSVSGRAYLDLQNLARRTRRNTQELLRLYALEGFLARLAVSVHAPKLVLKGGVLLAAYDTRRPTRDVDLQASDLSNDVQTILSMVCDIAAISVDDGLDYDTDAATADTIRDEDAYTGVRVRLAAKLATAQIGFHVDVNVGDPVWPAPGRVALPGLLARHIELAGYPLSMVHAEKIVTAVSRGVTNTRWRDFADVYTLAGRHPVDAAELRTSVERVAAHRQISLTPLTPVLNGWADQAQAQWGNWRRKEQLSETLPGDFATVVSQVAAFADPVLSGTAAGLWDPAARVWPTTTS